MAGLQKSAWQVALNSGLVHELSEHMQGWQVLGRTSPVSLSGLTGLACPQNSSCCESQAARHACPRSCSGVADLFATSGWKEDPRTAASCWHETPVPSERLPSSCPCVWGLAMLQSTAAPGPSSPPASPSQACTGLSTAGLGGAEALLPREQGASPSLKAETRGPAS